MARATSSTPDNVRPDRKTSAPSIASSLATAAPTEPPAPKIAAHFPRSVPELFIAVPPTATAFQPGRHAHDDVLRLRVGAVVHLPLAALDRRAADGEWHAALLDVPLRLQILEPRRPIFQPLLHLLRRRWSLVDLSVQVREFSHVLPPSP